MFDYSDGAVPLVLGLQQEVEHTASRRSGPRRWLRAVVWAVAAGLHPRAGATTQRIAEDLAARMDYSTGHVRYALDDMAARLGLSRATVKRHVAVLRETGLLAWLEHGTKANVRRALGLRGYAGTATVYAAVIPPAFDTAMGHVRVGSGYAARIVVPAAAGPAEPVINSPAAGAGEPPSLNVVKTSGHLGVEGSSDTSTAQARSDRSARPKKTLTLTGHKITAARIETARRLAIELRPLVNWAQGASYDQLSWVLLDMVGRGWSQPKILLWLRQLGADLGLNRRRPRWPHRLIAAALLRHDRAERARLDEQGDNLERDERAAVAPNQDFLQALQTARGDGALDPLAREEFPDLTQVPEDAEDRFALRAAAAADPSLIIACARLLGRDEALRIYGAAAAEILDAHTAGLLAVPTSPAPAR